MLSGMPEKRVFVGCSLDGFIAGPNDELDWLGGESKGEGAPAPPDKVFGVLEAVTRMQGNLLSGSAKAANE